ncbi:hypothetical protein [Bradyrhizobium sp. USDA 10063]
MARLRVVRPRAEVRQYAAPDAVPWPAAVAGERHGSPVRPAAPLPEVAPLPGVVRGGPWRVAQGAPLPGVVLLVGLLAQPRHRGKPWSPGRTSRRSKRLRRHQAGTL